MRTIGHDVKVEMLKATYETNLRRIEQYPARKQEQLAKRNPIYFQGYMENALRVARLGYLFDMPLDRITEVLRAALQELPLVIEANGMFHPPLLQEFLGAALLAKDAKMTSWLADLPPEAYHHPNVEVSQIRYLIVEAEQAGANLNSDRFSSVVAKMPLALAPENLILDEKEELELFEPTVRLLEAIRAKDQSSFESGWKEQASSWNRRFGKPDEVANTNGILDVETLGIGRIAQGFGLKVPGTNLYAPAELLGR